MRVALPKPKKETGIGLDTHEPFYGMGNRKNSKKYNCIIFMPHYDHEHNPETSPHKNPDVRQAQCEDYQQRLMDAGWTLAEFMETFGMNWLEPELLLEKYGEVL